MAAVPWARPAPATSAAATSGAPPPPPPAKVGRLVPADLDEGLRPPALAARGVALLEEGAAHGRPADAGGGVEAGRGVAGDRRGGGGSPERVEGDEAAAAYLPPVGAPVGGGGREGGCRGGH